ncbi:MAG: hypothetical protein ACK4GC_00665, partial [Paracoccaceae bacterium]
ICLSSFRISSFILARKFYLCSPLLSGGITEWRWLPEGTIQLRLFGETVFHLRETEIERII